MRLQTDPEIDDFLRAHFNETEQKLFATIPLGVMKADAWRYLIIQQKGGLYADRDVEFGAYSMEFWQESMPRVVYLQAMERLLIGVFNNHGVVMGPRAHHLMERAERFFGQLKPATNRTEFERIFHRNLPWHGCRVQAFGGGTKEGKGAAAEREDDHSEGTAGEGDVAHDDPAKSPDGGEEQDTRIHHPIGPHLPKSSRNKGRRRLQGSVREIFFAHPPDPSQLDGPTPSIKDYSSFEALPTDDRTICLKDVVVALGFSWPGAGTTAGLHEDSKKVCDSVVDVWQRGLCERYRRRMLGIEIVSNRNYGAVGERGDHVRGAGGGEHHDRTGEDEHRNGADRRPEHRQSQHRDENRRLLSRSDEEHPQQHRRLLSRSDEANEEHPQQHRRVLSRSDEEHPQQHRHLLSRSDDARGSVFLQTLPEPALWSRGFRLHEFDQSSEVREVPWEVQRLHAVNPQHLARTPAEAELLRRTSGAVDLQETEVYEGGPQPRLFFPASASVPWAFRRAAVEYTKANYAARIVDAGRLRIVDEGMGGTGARQWLRRDGGERDALEVNSGARVEVIDDAGELEKAEEEVYQLEGELKRGDVGEGGGDVGGEGESGRVGEQMGEDASVVFLPRRGPPRGKRTKPADRTDTTTQDGGTLISPEQRGAPSTQHQPFCGAFVGIENNYRLLQWAFHADQPRHPLFDAVVHDLWYSISVEAASCKPKHKDQIDWIFHLAGPSFFSAAVFKYFGCDRHFRKEDVGRFDTGENLDAAKRTGQRIWDMALWLLHGDRRYWDDERCVVLKDGVELEGMLLGELREDEDVVAVGGEGEHRRICPCSPAWQHVREMRNPRWKGAEKHRPACILPQPYFGGDVGESIAISDMSSFPPFAPVTGHPIYLRNHFASQNFPDLPPFIPWVEKPVTPEEKKKQITWLEGDCPTEGTLAAKRRAGK